MAFRLRYLRDVRVAAIAKWMIVGEPVATWLSPGQMQTPNIFSALTPPDPGCHPVTELRQTCGLGRWHDAGRQHDRRRRGPVSKTGCGARSDRLSSVGAVPPSRLPVVVDRCADQLDRHLDADRRCSVAGRRRTQRSNTRLVGAGGDNTAGHAARPTRWSAG